MVCAMKIINDIEVTVRDEWNASEKLCMSHKVNHKSQTFIWCPKLPESFFFSIFRGSPSLQEERNNTNIFGRQGSWRTISTYSIDYGWKSLVLCYAGNNTRHALYEVYKVTFLLLLQLRQESNTEPRKRFHLISKMRKAVVYAEQLRELCDVSVSTLYLSHVKQH